MAIGSTSHPCSWSSRWSVSSTSTPRVDGFVEAGAGVRGLSADGRRVQSLRTLPGARVVRTFLRQGLPWLMLEGRAAWAHELDPIEDASMRLVGDDTTGGFAVTTPMAARNAALVGASVAGEFWRGLQLSGDVNVELGSAVQAVRGSFGLRQIW